MIVAETLNSGTGYRFTDPDVFLNCDNSDCGSPWLTASAVVIWALAEDHPNCTQFSDRLLAACSPSCLESALHELGGGRRWSSPMPAGAFLDALRASLALDPLTTPIGEFVGVT